MPAYYVEYANLGAIFSEEVGAVDHRSYNIAPSASVLACIGGGRDDYSSQWTWLEWGHQPAWSNRQLINARGETISEKSTFRRAFAERRAVVAADGYYEWKRTASAKEPYHIRPSSGSPLLLASLWYESASRECVIITQPATGHLAQIHDRMPLMLSPQEAALWLVGVPQGTAEPLFGMREPLDALRVSRAVNNARNDGRDLITPLR